MSDDRLDAIRERLAKAFAIMRAAKEQGGTIEHCVTRYDHEKEGRVLELRVFWPGVSGYDSGSDKGETT